MASRLSPKRLGAAVLGASLALMTAALPAAADPIKIIPIERDDPDFGKHHEEGIELGLKGESREWFDANLIPLYVIENGDKTVVKAYCVELPTQLQNGTPLHEVPWNEHPNDRTKFKENAAKVNWILHHSYPLLEADALSEATGRDIDNREAIAATQAAIWHFTDGASLKDDPTKDSNPEVDADVKAVYAYLTGEKNTGIEQQPAPTLKVDPKELSGKAGELIGPFTVSTTADKVMLEADLPEGVTLTDKDGTELPTATEGDLGAQAVETKTADVYVKVAAGTEPGEVKFSVKANAQLQHGRLFVSVDSSKKTQSLIIAKPSEVKVEAEAKAKWVEGPIVTTTTTAAPTTTTFTTTTVAPTTTTTVASGGGTDDDLANTGASIFVPLLIGLGLLGAGAGALLYLRRKRTA
ncbi:thioester domain-containing protein [Saccharothrix stipae]